MYVFLRPVISLTLTNVYNDYKIHYIKIDLLEIIGN